MNSLLSQPTDERDARIFELGMEQFWKRWAPDDKYEAARFHAELSSLVRQVYHDAQNPMIEQISAMLSAMSAMSAMPAFQKKPL